MRWGGKVGGGQSLVLQVYDFDWHVLSMRLQLEHKVV